MGTRSPAWIEIGGELTPLEAEELLEMVKVEGMREDWGGGYFSSLDEMKDEESGTLRGYDEEASYGQFDELEKWLVGADIPFNRYSDACYEYGPEIVVFRRGMLDSRRFDSAQGGGVLIDAKDVRSVRELLRSGDTAAALAKLDECLAFDDLSEIPPFTIKAEVAASA